MNKNQYKELFDSVSPSRELIESTRRKAENMAERKTGFAFKKRALVLALCLLLTVGGAVAAVTGSGILSRLYEEPTERAMEAVVMSGDIVASEGITLTMDEYLMDGSTLHCAWTVTSTREEDVYYLTEYEILDDLSGYAAGGDYGAYGSMESGGDLLMVRLSPDAPSYSGYMGFGYDVAPERKVQVKVTVRAFTTELEPVEVPDIYEVIWYNDPAITMREYSENGQLPYGANNPFTSVASYPEVQVELENLLSHGEDYEAALLPALNESGLMKELTTLSIIVTVDPAEAGDALYALAEPETFTLPGRTVTLDEVKLDIASTLIRYTIRPDEAPDMTGNWSAGNWYLMYDQDGRLLNTAYGIGLDMGINNIWNEDGSVSFPEEGCIITVVMDGNPMEEAPEYIRFVPTCDLPRQEGVIPADYYAEMAAMAEESECFTLYLD